jgi:hypothetical protein
MRKVHNGGGSYEDADRDVVRLVAFAYAAPDMSGNWEIEETFDEQSGWTP